MSSLLMFLVQKESRLLKNGKAQEMARDTAHQTAEQILSSSPWKKPALYDVVYRIPEASLKLARDDRQAGLWYREERKNADKGLQTTKHQPLVVRYFMLRPRQISKQLLLACASNPAACFPLQTDVNALIALSDKAAVAQDGPTWVSITLNGRAVNVLVDESGRVLGQREADPVVHTNGSGLDE